MVALILLALRLLAAFFKSKSRLEAEKGASPAYQRRSPVLRPALSLVPTDPRDHNDRSSRDTRALASCWISPLLDLEVSLAGRPPADRNGVAGANTSHEPREATLGCATHSR